jgi:ABC-type phosphate/phosphonate transport system substrate-binding protein
MEKPLIIGAVLYDPKVSVIWDIIREYFEANHVEMDVVYFTNYELQVGSLLSGHVDIAWNSPLAWVDTRRRTDGACKAIAMRDTDQDRSTHFIARKGSGIRSLKDLKGKTIGFGAKDSPQATLIPIQTLSSAGLKADSDYTVRRFNVLVGKHGDHIGGERDAFDALNAGEVDASCLLDLNWDAWTADGTINSSAFEIVDTTPRFDHCVFTVLEAFPKADEARFLEALFAMDYDNPDHQEMMDLEGLKKWEAGRTTGFGPLTSACELTRYFEEA